MIGPIVYTLLSGNSAIAARVGTRIYPNVAPQDKAFLTRLVYFVPVQNGLTTLDGTSSRFEPTTIQIDCYSKQYIDAQALADDVCALLDALNQFDSQRRLLTSHRINRRDLYEPEQQLHRVLLEFSFTVRNGQ